MGVLKAQQDNQTLVQEVDRLQMWNVRAFRGCHAASLGFSSSDTRPSHVQIDCSSCIPVGRCQGAARYVKLASSSTAGVP